MRRISKEFILFWIFFLINSLLAVITVMHLTHELTHWYDSKGSISAICIDMNPNNDRVAFAMFKPNYTMELSEKRAYTFETICGMIYIAFCLYVFYRVAKKSSGI